MFDFIKNSFYKLFKVVTTPLQNLFARQHIDDSSYNDLEKILIEADTGMKTTRSIMAEVKKSAQAGHITNGSDLKNILNKELAAILANHHYKFGSSIYMLVGVNGSGKTTLASKLAYFFQKQGKKVLLVAADTFRAAAQEQLKLWATRAGTDIVVGSSEQQDPAAVVFKGCQAYLQGGYDILIIDTAGRLQTKVNLMHELEKMKRVVAKQLPTISLSTLLIIDSMLGQNSFEQAKLFHESTPLSGVVLTKMDGTGKGGIVFSIVQTLQIPVAYISYGEDIESLMPFDGKAYVDELLGS